MSGLRDAQRALARGATEEALVYLWNELEPARLAGDRRGLAAIGRMAAAIAEHGDAAQRRDASCLLAELEEASAAEAAPAPEPVPLAIGTEPVREDEPAPPFEPLPEAARPVMPEAATERAPVAGEEDAEGEPGRPRIASLLWAALVVAVILLNIVRNLLEGS